MRKLRIIGNDLTQVEETQCGWYTIRVSTGYKITEYEDYYNVETEDGENVASIMKTQILTGAEKNE